MIEKLYDLIKDRKVMYFNFLIFGKITILIGEVKYGN